MKPARPCAAGIFCLLVLLATGPALAGHPMEELLPAAGNLPAPSWVRPGLRLTYYAAAASLANKRHFFWRDEKGNWVGQGERDKGERYRRGEQSGAGGHGYTQVDVVALENGRCKLPREMAQRARRNGISATFRGGWVFGLTNPVNLLIHGRILPLDTLWAYLAAFSPFFGLFLLPAPA